MSGNAQTKMRLKIPERKAEADQRIRRSKQRLGQAMIDLMQEKPVSEITVQEVLKRAGVGRSTFYLHFSDKNDLLLCQLEQFLEFMSTMLIARKDPSRRVLPVAEMFDHIGGQNKLLEALKASGHIHEFYEMAQIYFARAIEKRLASRMKNLPKDLAARSSVLAGGLIALLQWWIAHGAKETPAAVDEMFHRVVWSGMGGVDGVR